MINREDIIRWAHEASNNSPNALLEDDDLAMLYLDELERFAALVAAASEAKEREACAKFVEDGYVRQFERPWREDLAAAIRARGQA